MQFVIETGDPVPRQRAGQPETGYTDGTQLAYFLQGRGPQTF